MNGLVCSRCLGSGAIVAFNGKHGYPCPSCAPPHLREEAIALDVINQLCLLEAIDENIAKEIPEGTLLPSCGPEHAYPHRSKRKPER